MCQSMVYKKYLYPVYIAETIHYGRRQPIASREDKIYTEFNTCLTPSHRVTFDSAEHEKYR